MILKHFKKSIWIICLLGVLLIPIIFITVTIICIGPDTFIDKCLEIISANKKETWAFLVAGSKNWENYRHQADISHAYQTLLNNGIPADHIVVMMADDIAHNKQNSFPGQIFNHPNGLDVYHGINIDYRSNDVNSENFLNILIGNKTAMQNIGSGRTIESKHGDNIFLNFVGHGASGILAFPDSLLYADELNIALQSMVNRRTFKKMLLYIEACKSGSLFDSILSQTDNIFAVTAAGPRENSWATYCFDDFQTSNVCLGDEFSVTWMEDQSNIDLLYPLQINELIKTRTVLNHFNYIRTMVKESNVMPYGDFRVGLDKLSAYMGKPSELNIGNFYDTTQSYIKSKVLTIPNNKVTEYSKILFLPKEQHAVKENITKQWQQHVNYNIIIDTILNNILQGVIKRWPSFVGDVNEFKEVPGHLPLAIFPCYKQILNDITKYCFPLPKNQYSLGSVHIFFNLCRRFSNNKEWTYDEFGLLFKEVVLNVCTKNSSILVDLHKMSLIF